MKQEQLKVNRNILRPGIDRRTLLSALGLLPALSAPPVSVSASARTASSGTLSSWNEGSAKQAILDFVRDTTDPKNSKFVPPEERIATFDQDGTLWVEHPIYCQMMYCLDRVPVLAAQQPALKEVEPFKTVLSGNREAIARLSMQDLEKIVLATLTGMTTDEFEADGKNWLASAKDPRWKRPYTELVYQPMLEVMTYLRASGFKTYIVTGFGQDFVRLYSQQVYGIPPEQVIGSALAVKYAYGKDGKPILIPEPKVMLNDTAAGKPEGIHLMIGRRPNASFGNSIGDQQMLEYTGAGGGSRLSMLVLHDDARREYAYGPAQGLPDTKIGTLTSELYAEAKNKNWTLISMKNDWNRIFSFE